MSHSVLHMITANPMVPVSGVVQRFHKETSDTFSIDVKLVSKDAFGFLPGQFNMLYLFGTGEIPISISGDPSEPGKIMHTTREVGLVTRALRRLRPGDELGVRGPFGNSWPLDIIVGKDLVLVAGGIGLAPLRPVIYAALANRKRFNRMVLLFGARSPSDLLYRNELRRWRARLDMDVQITVDRASDSWRGNVGVITRLIPLVGFNPNNVIAMICGPEIMTRFAVVELEKRGVRNDQIYVSLERNMKCAIGLCGHCQFGASFICRDGPIFRYDRIAPQMRVDEL